MNRPRLVLIHGWGTSRSIWNPLTEVLTDHFECFNISLPGYGDQVSEQFPEGLNELSQKILDSAPPGKAHWCGWSLGGMAAMQAALAQPARFQSLSLLCSTPRFVRDPAWPQGMDMRIFRGFSRQLREDYQKGMQRFLMLQTGGGGASTRAMVRNVLELISADPEPNFEVLDRGLSLLQNADLRPNVGELQIPCQIISGQRDRIVHPELCAALHRLIPGSSLRVLNSGHAPMLSHTPDLADLLLHAMAAH